MNNKRNIRMHSLRTIITSFFLFAVLLPTFAQELETAEKELDSVALKMFEYVNNRNYEGIMDLTHPKVFELVPKEMMVNVFKSMFEGNEEFSIELPEVTPDYKLSSVFSDEENKTDFAFVSYDMTMSMTFNREEGFDDEGKEMMINMMKMQGMNVEFVSDKTLNVEMPNRMTIMLNDESTDNKWVMINYDPDSPLFFQVLSAPVLEQAKSYYQDLMIESKKKE